MTYIDIASRNTYLFRIFNDNVVVRTIHHKNIIYSNHDMIYSYINYRILIILRLKMFMQINKYINETLI